MIRARIPNVYKYYPSGELEIIAPLDKTDYDRAAFDGTSRAANWIPIRVERITEDLGRRLMPCDLPFSSLGDIVFNQDAKKKIGTFLEQYGELLPLACDDGEFWTLNVTCIIDALDESKSVALKSSEPGRLLMIDKYVFHIDRLQDAVVFKIPQNTRARPLVTTPFVELIQSSGLTGLKFKQIWAPN